MKGFDLDFFEYRFKPLPDLGDARIHALNMDRIAEGVLVARAVDKLTEDEYVALCEFIASKWR